MKNLRVYDLKDIGKRLRNLFRKAFFNLMVKRVPVGFLCIL